MMKTAYPVSIGLALLAILSASAAAEDAQATQPSSRSETYSLRSAGR
jgi:hypothetical protein